MVQVASNLHSYDFITTEEVVPRKERQSSSRNDYDLGQPAEQVVNVSELVVNHQGKHTHLGSTALVKFLGTVVVLGFFCIGTDEANGEARSGEVSRVGAFGSKEQEYDACEFQRTKERRPETDGRNERDLLLPSGEFKGAAEGKDLKGARDGDSEGGVPAGAEVGELGSIGGDVTREVDTGLVDQVSDNTKHADASVLDLNTTEAIELFLVSVSNEAKGIKETKRGLGAEFIFEGLEGSRGSSLLGRSKGSGRGGEGGDNSELHCCWCRKFLVISEL